MTSILLNAFDNVQIQFCCWATLPICVSMNYLYVGNGIVVHHLGSEICRLFPRSGERHLLAHLVHPLSSADLHSFSGDADNLH